MTASVLFEEKNESPAPDGAATSLRVSVDLLDTLMNLAGELVLGRNQLLQGIGAANPKAVELSGQRIDMITSELQEAIMQTRMQPIGNILNKFNRIVRDLSHQTGTSVNLILEGETVELDKTILEAMTDPLICLIRNSVTYGIEPPEERREKGKDPSGTIQIRAFHEAGQVNILISDDGRGMDPDRIFESTVPSIEILGGVIDFDATPGQGTDILIKLPLTLAIIPSQIIVSGDERYAVPQVNLNELLRIPTAEIRDRIEKVGDAAVVRLRGELLPLLNLADVLGLEQTCIDPETGEKKPDRRKNVADRRAKQYVVSEGAAVGKAALPAQDSWSRQGEDRRKSRSNAVNIAVVSAGAFTYGLVVDQLRDSEEIVVKPVGRHVKKYSAYAGATIMGDGKVALILDIANLAQSAGITAVSEAAQAAALLDRAGEDERERMALLRFRNTDTEYFAAPQNLVERVERIRASDIQRIGRNRAVKYRGGTLLLFEIAQVADFTPLPEREFMEIVVFRVRGREIGLLVSPPVDLVEGVPDLDESPFRQPTVSGSMTIMGHTTLVIDIDEMVRTICPDWFAGQG